MAGVHSDVFWYTVGPSMVVVEVSHNIVSSDPSNRFVFLLAWDDSRA